MCDNTPRRNTHDEMIALITAHKEGKKLEFRWVDGKHRWSETDFVPSFNFAQIEYRVKEEPKYYWMIRHRSNVYCFLHDHLTEQEAWKKFNKVFDARIHTLHRLVEG